MKGTSEPTLHVLRDDNGRARTIRHTQEHWTGQPRLPRHNQPGRGEDPCQGDHRGIPDRREGLLKRSGLPDAIEVNVSEAAGSSWSPGPDQRS